MLFTPLSSSLLFPPFLPPFLSSTSSPPLPSSSYPLSPLLLLLHSSPSLHPLSPYPTSLLRPPSFLLASPPILFPPTPSLLSPPTLPSFFSARPPTSVLLPYFTSPLLPPPFPSPSYSCYARLPSQPLPSSLSFLLPPPLSLLHLPPLSLLINFPLTPLLCYPPSRLSPTTGLFSFCRVVFLHIFFPQQPAPPHVDDQAIACSQSIAGKPPVVPRKRPTCRACGEVGHRSTNRQCIRHLEHREHRGQSVSQENRQETSADTC